MSLTKLTADRATLDAAIKAANTELTTLQGQRTTLVNQITPLQTQLTAAQSELAGSEDPEGRRVSSLATKEAELAAAKTRLDSATAAATTAQNAGQRPGCGDREGDAGAWPDSSLRGRGPGARGRRREEAGRRPRRAARARGCRQDRRHQRRRATAAVVKAEENLRLAEQSVTT
jgi:hypothetical protein